ncbi:TetR-like C-terminal domain-containing protein [Yinghuangia aomiensis]
MLRAVRELLAADGYGRLSFETVARRAGVTLSDDLPPLAVESAPGARRGVPHRGRQPRAHRRHRGLRRRRAPHGRRHHRVLRPARGAAALPGLFTDLHADRELRAQVVDGLRNHALAEFRALVDGARARGELRDGVDADVLFDTISGAAFTRVVSEGDVPPGYVEALTQAVVLGAVARP